MDAVGSGGNREEIGEFSLQCWLVLRRCWPGCVRSDPDHHLVRERRSGLSVEREPEVISTALAKAENQWPGERICFRKFPPIQAQEVGTLLSLDANSRPGRQIF